MISVWRQFRLLLWKDIYVIKRKQKVLCFVEIFIPILLFLLLVLIRTRNFDVDSPSCHYDSKPLTSAGVLPFAHGFFCSFANNCHLSPTTGDERHIINNSTRESLAVNGIRWWLDVFEQVGENSPVWDIIFATGVEMIRSTTRVKEDPETMKRYPFHLLFQSESSMDYVLRKELKYDETDIDRFNNLYMTPFFPICALDIFHESQDTIKYLFDEPVDSFCNPVKLRMCFIGDQFDVGDLDLCKITYQHLFLLVSTYPDQFDLNHFTNRFFAYVVPDKMKDIPPQVNETLTGKGLANMFNSFPDSSFFTGLQNTSIMDALFCGKFQDLINSESNQFGITFNPNSVLVSTKRKIMEFIQNVLPSQKTSGKTVCGNITVHELGHCSNNLLNFKMAKSLIQGYILVSPDTPLVRSLIEPLNTPFLYANLLRDLAVDLDTISMDLQDAANKSEMNLFVNIVAEQLFKAGMIDNVTENNLKHMFHDSSDPNALFPRIKDLLKFVINSTSCIRFDRFIYVESEHELEKAALCLGDFNEYYTGIVFPDINETVTELPPFVSYKIRHNSKLIDSTGGISDTRNILSRDNPLRDLKYLTFGFVFLQEAIENRIVEHQTNTTVKTGVYTQQEPYPCTKTDAFNVTIFLSLFVMLSWMTPASLLVKSIVYEKEMRLKEMMRIMSLGDVIHWVAWGFQTLFFNLISIFIISFLLKYGRIMPNTDLTLLMCILFLFAMACAAQCIYLSVFFSRANLATACTALLFFLMFIPFQLSIRSNNFTFTMITLIFPQSAIGYGFTMLAFAEDAKLATWATLDQIELAEYHVKMVHVLVALAIEVVIYSILAWYISAVFPGAYGVPLPFYFCFTLSYWKGANWSTKNERPRSSGCNFSYAGDNFEPVPPSQKLAVEIRDMVKIYNNNTKALDYLSVSFYENQITGFLGHNGAGKSTTMSILCGLYPPTDGTAFVYDMDIRTEMASIRDQLGVCPQHNILFDNMTVEEQLQFYACLKGVPSNCLKAEVDLFLVDIGLTDKRNALSHELSGGMKRKLSIAIALIGGSKLVILDEPTADKIDAHARRAIWSLLIKHKEGRTIILSTHHMDEADVLSDRIAIIAEGQLKTAGSSMFLKKKFGLGFRLTIVKKPEVASLERRLSIHSSGADHSLETVSNRMSKFLEVNNFVEVKLVEDLGVDLQYLLPLTATEQFLAEFFQKLEAEKTKIGIETYGFTVPSLQQIFLTVAPHRELVLKKRPNIFVRIKNALCFHRRSRYIAADVPQQTDVEVDAKHLVKDDENETATSDDLVHPPMSFIKSNWILRAQQCRALFIKRINVSKRNLLPMFFELIMPILVLLIAELYAKFQIENRDFKFMVSQKPMNITQTLYGNGTQFYVGIWENSTHPDLDALMNNPGPGLRCVNGLHLKSVSGQQMDCVAGDQKGHLDFQKDWNVNYTLNQTCGCSESGGWDCTSDEYPVKDLQRMRFNTTDYFYSVTGRNISQFRMVTFDNTTQRKEPILGGWTFGHKNYHGKDSTDLKFINQGFRMIWRVFNETSGLMNFDWQSVVNNATLATNNDTFLPDDPTIFDSFEFMFRYMDIPEGVKVWYNNKNWVSLPINVNLFYNAALRSRLPPGKSPSDYGILPISHPANDTAEDILNSMAIQKSGTFRVVLMTLAICVIASSFSMFLVDESSSKSTHLQKVFGISPWLYHCVNLIYDFIFYFICILLIIFVYWSVGTTLFTFSMDAFTSSLIVFIFYGFCILPFIYICQMFFTVPSMAFAIISIGLFLFGVTSTTTVMLLENLQTDDHGLETANSVCSVVFLLIPPYNFGMAINRLSFIHNLRIFGGKFLENIGRADLIDKLPLPQLSEWELMGKHIVCLFLSAIIYTVLLMIIEYRNVLFKFLRVFERKHTARLYAEVEKENMDVDVKTEQEFVEKMDDFDGYGLVVKTLCKTYNKKNLAVKGITFSVGNGEVFGLLGVNGAGKTTTFSMLTGSLAIGSGDVIVCGSSIVKDNFLSLRDIGYCPQFDALNLKLTAREHLFFYARIRGVCEVDIEDTVDWALTQMKLKPYADEIAESYSGGNKRKLSAAIALISDPPVVLLDEPSSGMDPSSQLFMWNLILQLRRSNRTVIITSHSMEECEALCSKTAIMVEGQFRCLGSIQHLKERFGDGYTLSIKLLKLDQVDKLKLAMEEILPEATLVSLHLLTFFYRIKGTSSILPVVFKRIGELRSLVSIEDFSISQTSLDDVFISFAMAAAPDEIPTDLDAKVSISPAENGNAANGRAHSSKSGHIRSISETGQIENTAL